MVTGLPLWIIFFAIKIYIKCFKKTPKDSEDDYQKDYKMVDTSERGKVV